MFLTINVSKHFEALYDSVEVKFTHPIFAISECKKNSLIYMLTPLTVI